MPKKDPTDTVAHWRIQAERNRPAKAALDYMAALGCTAYVATHGVSRNEAAGAYQMGVGHPQAQALLRAERRHLAGRAKALLSKLDTIVGELETEPQSEGQPMDLLQSNGSAEGAA